MQAEHAKQKDSSEREIARLRAEMGRIATGIIATEMGRTPSADPSRATSERGSIFSDSFGREADGERRGARSSRGGRRRKGLGGETRRSVVFHVEGPSAFAVGMRRRVAENRSKNRS